MKHFSNILFVAEPGVDDTAALEQAISLAENNQAQLAVVAAVDPGSSVLSPDLRKVLIIEREEQLAQLVAGKTVASGPIETKVLSGRPFLEIIKEVLRNKRDLVVKSYESGAGGTAGGTDTHLLRKCPCPVWMIRSTEQKGYKEILAALEFEPDNPENEPLNRQIIELAASLALSEFAELHVVHAWRLDHESFLRSTRAGLSAAEVDKLVEAEEDRRRNWLGEFVNDCCRSLGSEASQYLNPRFHLIQGPAQEVVPRVAGDLGAELIVMGTVGRTGIPGFFIGNTAEKILTRIDCSVLAVKPAGFLSPVTVDTRG